MRLRSDPLGGGESPKPNKSDPTNPTPPANAAQRRGVRLTIPATTQKKANKRRTTFPKPAQICSLTTQPTGERGTGERPSSGPGRRQSGTTLVSGNRGIYCRATPASDAGLLVVPGYERSLTADALRGYRSAWFGGSGIIPARLRPHNKRAAVCSQRAER